jgi:hypothetical protein
MRSSLGKTPLRLFALCLVAVLAGCASGRDEQLDKLQVDGYSVRSLRSEDNESLNEQLFAAANLKTDLSDYLLGACESWESWGRG